MKHKLAAGMVAGMTLALAVPTFAQVTSSSTGDTQAVIEDNVLFTRGAPFERPSLEDMIERDQAFLANADAIHALHKSATQAHLDALVAAQALTDEDAREAAVTAAHDAMRKTIDDAIEANPDLKGVMMHVGMGHGGRGPHGPKPALLAEKLGMTEEELKAAIESGKTIEQIAEEKGVELPARPMFFMHRFDGAAPASASSVQ